MNSREKKSIVITFIYIAIMAIGMLTITGKGLTYQNPRMVNVLILFESLMTIIAFSGYKILGLSLFKKNFEFNIWLIPYTIFGIVMLILFAFQKNITQNFNQICMIILTTLFVGFSEELIFRGILLNVFSENRSLKNSILVSSVAFSLLHSVNILGGVPLAGTIVQLFLTLVFGIIFACLATLIHNIIPLMIYHFIWDMVLLSTSLTNTNIGFMTFFVLLFQIMIAIPIMLYTLKKSQKSIR